MLLLMVEGKVDSRVIMSVGEHKITLIKNEDKSSLLKSKNVLSDTAYSHCIDGVEIGSIDMIVDESILVYVSFPSGYALFFTCYNKNDSVVMVNGLVAEVRKDSYLTERMLISIINLILFELDTEILVHDHSSNNDFCLQSGIMLPSQEDKAYVAIQGRRTIVRLKLLEGEPKRQLHQYSTELFKSQSPEMFKYLERALETISLRVLGKVYVYTFNLDNKIHISIYKDDKLLLLKDVENQYEADNIVDSFAKGETCVEGD